MGVLNADIKFSPIHPTWYHWLHGGQIPLPDLWWREVVHYLNRCIKFFDIKKLLCTTNRNYGCGAVYPEAVDGCSVLDLGSGAGIDCFVLSKLVGPGGKVVGVDMTKEQVTHYK
jgi:ubiquinone/menaquinone biosynthesis C-methylase UbiE